MSQETIIANTEVSFKDFLFKNKRNRTILWIAAAAIVIQWALFKYFYPFASFIHGDSFSYIKAAFHNSDINTYLIGYSKFLRLFSVFSTSDLALTSFQYLLIQASAFLLVFTFLFFYNFSKIAQGALLCFIVFNPLFLHLANLISSDGIFLSLSFIWFTTLLWVIHRPSFKIIILHATLLFLTFTIRYNAIMYPLISTLAFGMSNASLRQKFKGIAIALILCGLFTFFTSYQYKKLTGLWQYSPFSGWQMTNNAMYAYRYVDSASRKPVPQKYKAIDNMIREYFDSTRDVKKYPLESIQASTVYMWTKHLTLYKYREGLFKNDTSATEFKKWAYMGPFYKSYGMYIIRQYPLHFLKYFIWPNANKYYAPPVEFLDHYNSDKDSVSQLAKVWFNYKSNKIKPKLTTREIKILDFYPILSGVINLVMLCCLVCFFALKKWQKNTSIQHAILLGASFWLFNALFTISASSAALRFQSFPIILSTLFVVIQIDWMLQVAKLLNKKQNANLLDNQTRANRTQQIVLEKINQ